MRKKFRKKYKDVGFFERIGNRTVETLPRLWKQVKKIKHIINAEQKYIDYSASTTVNNAGGVVFITGITQGTAATERTGVSIKAVSHLMRFDVQLNPNATSSMFRILVFIDDSCNGANPAVTDVLNAASYLSPLNINNGKRFRVVWDKLVRLSTNGNAIVGKKVFKKLNHHIRYNGTGSTVTSAKEGNMFCLVISDETTDVPTWNVNVRTRYYDN